MTLNLLRTLRINPRLSAWSQVHGTFDFNRTPLPPPGTDVLVHEKPSLRGTWSPHAVDGWYLGLATLHYRCYRVWILKTTSERIADTVVWFSTKVSMPNSSSTDAAIAAARDLTNTLLHPSPASPLSPISDSQHAALQQLSTIFHEITDPGPAKIPTPMTVAKTTTVPPGFEPLPRPVSAALSRVPSPPSTTPSPLPASLPRVPTQPRLPAPPAAAVNAFPNCPAKLTKLAPAMPANDAANDTKPSAPPPSKQSSKKRRMNPQLLVQPLAQYRTPASRKNATAPKLPRTLSITSVPCLPSPHRLIQRPHQSPSTIPQCLFMPFGPPTPPLIPAPAPPWSIPSSNWARAANSGLQLPRVKAVALLKANNRTCPLALT